MSSQELPRSKINVQEPRFNAQGQMLQPQGSTAKLSNAVWGGAGTVAASVCDKPPLAYCRNAETEPLHGR